MYAHHLNQIERLASPQVKKVLQHLLKFGSITGNKAQDYRIRALPRRICDLEEIIWSFDYPYEIKRTWNTDLEGQRYVEYTLHYSTPAAKAA